MIKFFLIVTCFIFITCNQQEQKSTITLTELPTTPPKDSTNEVTTESGLKYSILKKGIGPAAQAGHEVLIHETLSYMNDSFLLFDSRKLPNPVKVLIGAHQAIKGVDEGLRGMQKGEIRRLIVPPSLSKRIDPPTFPHPDSTLVYVIELMEILPPKNK